MFRDKILYSQPFGLQDAFIHSNICGSQTFTPGFCFCAVFRALRSSALVAVRRRVFFITKQEAQKMKLKYNCPGCGTPLGYEGLCWKCKCEQERNAALAWTSEQIAEKQKN